MESVYLHSPHNEFYVDTDGYLEIYRLVKAHQLCHKERHPFSEDNPCVGRNLCLEHVLHQQPQLTYLGIARKSLAGQRIYRYIDQHGYLYTSTEDSSDEATQSLKETLAYHHFVPPETITYREHTVAFYDSYATLYGDLNSASVIVMTFDKRSTETVKGLFLLYNDGTQKEIVKRGEHKQLFTRAQAILAATKDTAGVYHLPSGSTRSVLYEEDCYPVISQLESAMFDVMRSYQTRQAVQEEASV